MSEQRKFTEAEIDEIKCAIIAWLLSTQQAPNTKAAEQILRTQVHPKLYETASHLQELMNNSGSFFIRRVAENVGYQPVSNLFPQAKEILHLYEQGVADYKLLGDAYADLVSLAAVWSQEIRERLFSAVYSAQIYDMLSQRMKQIAEAPATNSIDLFQREHELIKQQAARERISGYEPTQFNKIQPVVITLQQSDEPAHYQVSSFFRLYDPIHRQYDYHVGQPELCTRYEVDSQVSIPWERVSDGLTIEYSMPDNHGFYHTAQHYHITAEQIEKMKSRGTAVPTTIGKMSDIRLYDEHASSAFHQAKLPDSAMLSLRATPSTLEVKKRVSDIRLTVFV